MARYTGPKSRIARKFREPIFGPDKAFEKKNYPPGQHGQTKKRNKQSEYSTQLMEKQKVKYMAGKVDGMMDEKRIRFWNFAHQQCQHEKQQEEFTLFLTIFF